MNTIQSFLPEFDHEMANTRKTLERAPEVLQAGADSIAVISDILKAKNPATRAGEYIERLEAVKPAARH